MNSTKDYSNITEIDFGPPDIQQVQIAGRVFFGLVFLLGVPGNAMVLWVTGFCMPRSVTSLWFLNLALADLLCCLSIPLHLVPPNHWPDRSLACSLINGLLHLLFFCSVMQLVLISVDRWLLVSRPVWCQNKRRPRQAAFCCVVVWMLAIVFSIRQIVNAKVIEAGTEKRECIIENDVISSWGMACRRFLIGFFLPILIIAACHIVVYCRAESGSTRARTRSKRTLRVIVAVILSFFLCWFPVYIVEFLYIVTPISSDNRPNIYKHRQYGHQEHEQRKGNDQNLTIKTFSECLQARNQPERTLVWSHRVYRKGLILSSPSCYQVLGEGAFTPEM